jgi:CheY-like chemotaxis protein
MTTVLYVEDDAHSRTIFNMLMTMRLKIPRLAILEDSTDFEERVSFVDPPAEVIFLDIHVQPLDGYAMLSILRGMPQYRTTPVIALTASVMNEEVERLREAGFSGVVSKPINLSTFPAIFQRILTGEQIWHVVD